MIDYSVWRGWRFLVKINMTSTDLQKPREMAYCKTKRTVGEVDTLLRKWKRGGVYSFAENLVSASTHG